MSDTNDNHTCEHPDSQGPEERTGGESPQANDAPARENAQASPDNADSGGASPMPAPTFTTFVLSLASSGLVQPGEVPDPTSGKTETNLALAQHTIDLLSMLQEKIQNGLDAEESRLLDGLLYELRMKFVMKK